MKKIFIYASIILHITLIIISLFKFSDIFNKKIVQDSGHAVFDFISVGDKSTAPVLSPENGRASKTKSYASNEKKEDTITNKQNDNIQQVNNNTSNEQDNHQTDKKEQVTHLKINNKSLKNDNKKVEKKDKVTPLQPNNIKDKSNKRESNKKEIGKNNESNNQNVSHNKNQSSKKNGKALVNLKQNKNSSSINKNNKDKKSFNSFLDNVLAEGDNEENTGANAESLGETLTANQIDQVRNTIRKCWHFPAGLKNAEQLVVDIKMELDRSGYVKKADIVDKNRMKYDSEFKVAAENAQRAVLDPKCNPLPLPKEKYNEWKDLELSFNPKDMVS